MFFKSKENIVAKYYQVTDNHDLELHYCVYEYKDSLALRVTSESFLSSRNIIDVKLNKLSVIYNDLNKAITNNSSYFCLSFDKFLSKFYLNANNTYDISISTKNGIQQFDNVACMSLCDLTGMLDMIKKALEYKE